MKRILVFSLVILSVFGAGYWWARQTPLSQPDKVLTARQIYVCPMHSHIAQDHPGKCPICGMDLVSNGASHDINSTQIQVDTSTQQQLGVRLETVKKSRLAQTIRTHAIIMIDDSTLYRVTPTMDGILIKLNASRSGQRFSTGDVLFEIYSEGLFQHQNEYLDFLKRLSQYRKSEAQMRIQNQKELQNSLSQAVAARQQTELDVRERQEQLATMLIPIQRDGERLVERLRYAGFTEAMLRTLTKTQHALSVIPVHAQRTCVVKDVSARPGMMLSPMSEIISCVDAARAWLEVVLYPDQASWARTGDSFTAHFDNNTEMTGRLSGLNPILDPATHTLHVRIPIHLTDDIRLGSYAEVTIETTPREVLSVPVGAVLRTGQGNFVMRAMGEGNFMPVKVVTGIETDARIAIREGLNSGDQVVVNGQFLLDAAASIADTAQRLTPTGGQGK